MSSGTIGRQTASYRQGLVLGLTMAEIMLLLVFCLLIAVGVALSTERAKRDNALDRLKRAETAATASDAALRNIRQNARLAELMDRAARLGSPREIDDYWRRLVDSSEAAARREPPRIPPTPPPEDGPAIAKLRQLLAEGANPDKIVGNAALAAAIDALLAEKNLGSLTPQQVAALLDKGIEASKPTDEADRRKGHNWPPIINLSEAGGYFFATGSAELTPSFATELRTVVVDKLLEIAESYDVDVIEVIGHTDEQPVNGRFSNLDRSLSLVTTGGSGAGILQWADNAGLGLARALSVVERLSADSRLRSFRILPLSGAQLIGIDGKLTRWDGHGDVRERRRIEIRMRKST
jgi:flagellar motor protein MotB